MVLNLRDLSSSVFVSAAFAAVPNGISKISLETKFRCQEFAFLLKGGDL